jgi:teichuronic acid biosynthesis glycosyltransferase TuaC
MGGPAANPSRANADPGDPAQGLSVLAITNMWPRDASYRGVFVRESVEAVRRQPGLRVDVLIVAEQGTVRGYLSGAWQVRRRVRQTRPDVLWVHYGLTALCTVLVRSARIVVSFYGSDINVRWQRWVARLFTRRAGRRVFVSGRLADRWPSPRNAVIPCGVDLRRFAAIDQAEARRRLGLDTSTLLVLFGGHPDNVVKDHARFSRVVDRVRQEFDVDVVSLAGLEQEALPLAYSAADALLFTSRRGSEGSPGVVKEALAAGLPVVSVDVGDVSERLAKVSPGACVAWYETDAETDAALARELKQVLQERRRSNGPQQVRWLSNDVVGEQLANELRRARGTGVNALYSDGDGNSTWQQGIDDT